MKRRTISRICKSCGTPFTFESVDDLARKDFAASMNSGASWDGLLVRCEACIESAREAARKDDVRKIVESSNFPPEAIVPWDDSKAGCSTGVRGEVLRWRPTFQQRSLWLSGEHGTGKTRMACELAANIATERECAVRFMSWPKICLDVSLFKTDKKISEVIDKGKRAQILVLDDVGGKTKLNDRMRLILYTIIDDRYMGRRTTIVTSNFDPEDFLVRERSPDEGDHIEAVVERIRNSYTQFGIELLPSRQEVTPF